MFSAIRRISLTQWIIVSMVLGGAFGYLFPGSAEGLKVVSTVFLNMVKCILVPLVFGTLVVGIAGHADDLRAVGRLAFRSLLYFEAVTTLALVIGLTLVNLTRPGVGITLPAPSVPATSLGNTNPGIPNFAATDSVGTNPPVAKMAVTHGPPEKLTFGKIFGHVMPTSFFDAASRNDVLQVVGFAVLFGIALTQVTVPQRHVMLGFCESLTEVMFKFTGVVMNFAPIGIFAAMAVTVGASGLGVLLGLAKLVLTLYAGLAVFCLVVLLPVALWARIPVGEFLRTLREPALLAFTTTSSDAALPDAMRRLIAFGVPKRIVSFVMPLGYSFNLDGSTLHLAVASIFVAQAAKVDLGIGQQVTLMVTLMLTSKGMAGVPRASQVILAGTLVTFGLPLEGVTLILGVDTLMDMARTTVNLIGNCLATAVMARWEGEFRRPEASALIANH